MPTDFIDKYLFELVAFVVALLVSWLATEPLKRLWRNKTGVQHALIPRVAAFVLAMGIIYGMWPANSAWSWWPWGMLAGLGSPLSYRIFIVVLKKYYPDIADAITGTKK